MQSVKEGVKEHVGEPLFGAVLVVFLLTIIRPLFLDAIPKIGGFDLSFWLIVFIGFITIYFIYIYFKKDVRNYRFFGIPGLIFLIVLFLWRAQPYLSTSTEYRTAIGAQHNPGWDFIVFSVIAAIWLLLYVLYVHKLFKPRFAAVLAIFSSAVLIYSVPATLPYLTSGDMFDSHWFYGLAERTIATGHIPDVDHLVYPSFNMRDNNRDPCDIYGMDYCKSSSQSNLSGTEFWAHHIEDFPEDMLYPSEESGLNSGGGRFLNIIFMTSMYSILEPIGFDLYDIVMLYGAIFGSLTIFVVYLFIRDLFAEMKPYNYISGLLAAFMLVFTPLFATRAVAGVAEDEPIGIFLMVSTLLLFILAFRRRSLFYAVLAGFVFLLFSLAWGPSGYVAPIMGAFMSLYAIVQFIHKKSCVSHLIYFVIPILIGVFFKQFIAHPHNSLNIGFPTSLMIWVPLGCAIILSIILEMIRTYMHGVIEIEEEKIEDKIENLFHKNIYQLGGGALVICLIGFILMGPANAFDLVYGQITGVTKESVVGHTIAEQKKMCTGTGDCVKKIVSSGGLWVAGIFALIMIPLLVYFGVAKRSMGALLVLAWAVPVLWNWIYSSQGGFAASLPLILMGSTIGLFAAANKRDLESLRIIATILIIITIPCYLFVSTAGVGIMHLGEGGDIHAWMPSLQFLNETNPEDAVITWWDYGHWIIPIADRPVLVHNIQSDQYEIQDVARFFVNKTDEEEAFKIVKSVNTLYGNYNKIKDKNQEIARDVGWRSDGKIGVNYALVDWTLIGKSAALHWIATGDVANPELYTYENIGGSSEWCKNKDISEDKIALCNNPNNSPLWCKDIDKIKEWCKDPDKFARQREETYTQCAFLKPAYYIGLPEHKTDLKTQIKTCLIEDKEANKCPPGVEAGYTFGARRIVFSCRYAGSERENAIVGLKFEIFETSEGFGIYNVYVIDLYGEQHSWDSWVKTRNVSILGVQSFGDILSLAISRPDDNIISTFRTLIYVENEWQEFMLTKLYLGTNADSYNRYGLCRASWCPEAPNHLEHFKLVDGFKGDKSDSSTWGYVRIWKILYDSDGDGIMDDVDNCPNELETYNNYSDEDGCPDTKPANLSISDLIPGLKESSVIFYHMDWCPHCVKMEPWVAELEEQGYDFYDLYNKDPEFEAKKALVQEHLSDIIDVGGGVPQFGCVSNKEKHSGEFSSKEDMQKFADECRNSAIG